MGRGKLNGLRMAQRPRILNHHLTHIRRLRCHRYWMRRGALGARLSRHWTACTSVQLLDNSIQTRINPSARKKLDVYARLQTWMPTRNCDAIPMPPTVKRLSPRVIGPSLPLGRGKQRERCSPAPLSPTSQKAHARTCKYRRLPRAYSAFTGLTYKRVVN